MVGGGTRRDDTVVLNSTNVFAALGSLKKKKKSDKNKEENSSKSKSKEVFWAPTPLTAKSWADVDDDDDDDYYATAAPPPVWAPDESKQNKETLDVSIFFLYSFRTHFN